MKQIYQSSWKLPENFHEQMESFINAASLVIKSAEILLKHKKYLLDTIVWKVTEAGGKNKKDTRFISESVYNADKLGNPDKIKFEHEHVRPKRKVVQDLLDLPEKIQIILNSAVACTVTHEEHRLLKDGEGWDRYKAANIRVYDRLEKKFTDSK